jgi:endonuclease/exonuclease/phosphatase family metal-dependent hydrolase
MAGGARREEADPRKYALLGNLLTDEDTPPVDILALQEVVRVEDPSGGRIVRDDLALLKAQSGLRLYDSFFFPYLDSAMHPHPAKWESRIFKEWSQKGYRIYEGTAILLKDGHSFWHLLHDDRPGSPSGQVIPWYTKRPTFYRGNRDTSPRTLLMARVKIGNRFIVFCCIHLSCLKKEDQPGGGRVHCQPAVDIRERQIKWIVDYLEDYQEARKEFSKEEYREDDFVLAGDFNAEPGAPELSALAASGLKLEMAQVSPTAYPNYSHRTHKIPIDLIFAQQKTGKTARILDLRKLESAGQGAISDHYPVVAELEL